MKYIIGFILLALLIIIFSGYPKRLDDYNAHACAVYGKQADCVTPLSPELRLK